MSPDMATPLLHMERIYTLGLLATPALYRIWRQSYRNIYRT